MTRQEIIERLKKLRCFDIESGGYSSGHSKVYDEKPLGEQGYWSAGDHVDLDDVLEAFDVREEFSE